MHFKNKDGAHVVFSIIETIQNNKDYLSEIDGLIGDGDHGINMNKGFSTTKQKLENRNISLSEGLSVLGNTLVSEIGGSMGPLYGMFFIGMSNACSGKEDIDKVVIKDMLNAGSEGVTNIGNAKVGDKTLVDVLVPAVDAFNNSIKKDDSLKEALIKLKDAAKIGRESTINMVAKIGRASRLGERSKGVPDAGATSCNLILQSFATAILDIVNKQTS